MTQLPAHSHSRIALNLTTALVAVVALVAAFSLVGCSGGLGDADAPVSARQRRPIPAIDRKAPVGLETAVFGLG